MRRSTGCLTLALVVLLAALAGAAQASAGNPGGRLLGVVRATAAATAHADSQATDAGLNLTFHGGPVMHADHAYAIYWEPPGHTSTADYKDAIDGFLTDIAADSGKTTNVYAAQTLYSDAAGAIAYDSTFEGRIVDANPYPVGGCQTGTGDPCLTDQQLQDELERLVAADSLPHGEDTIYLIFTPPNVVTCDGVCAFSYFCAYHSWIGTGPTALIYADQPYLAGHSGCDRGNHPNAGDADPTINALSHEQNEAVTDPEGTGWWDYGGQEIGDKCAWIWGPPLGSTANGTYNQVIAGHRYWLQEEWSNLGSTCVQTNDGLAPPSVAITSPAPYGAAPGQPIAFTATATDPAGGTIVSYAWDFGDGQTATGAAVSHTYAKYGYFTVTVTVTDDAGRTSSDAQAFSLVDQPFALVSTAVSSAVAGDSVTFDASGSHSPGGAITAYDWTFVGGGGQYDSGSGPTVTETVLHPGTFVAYLTVTDAAGFSGYASQTLTAVARPPTAVIAASTDRQFTGLSIDFDGTASTGPDSPLAVYAWDFGDGHTSTSSSPSHTFAAGGDYTVTLTVTDSDGRAAHVSHTVTIVHRPPVPEIVYLPRAPIAGQVVELDGTGSYSPDGSVAGYRWDFGDGQTADGPSPDHTFAVPGTYGVRLTATDAVGAPATTVRQIVVAAAPVAAPVPPNSPPAQAPTQPPTASIAAVAPAPTGAVGLAAHQRLASLGRTGLRFSVTCTAACRITYAFVVAPHARTGETLLRGGSGVLPARGTRRITARISRASLKLLAAHRKPLLIVELTNPATGESSWFGAATAVS